MGRAEEMTDAIAAAEAEEETEELEGTYVRPLPPKQPAQVYSVRIPVERIEELRRVAQRAGVAPSVLIRRWVTEKLDIERRKGNCQYVFAAPYLRSLPGVEDALRRETNRFVGAKG